MKRLLIGLSTACALGVAVFLWMQPEPDRFRHNVPCGIEVDRSGFATSDYLGIGGPGDFFAIFAAFELSEASAQQIKNGGINFLQGLRCEKSTPHQNRSRDYFEWQETPGTLQSPTEPEFIESIEIYLSSREIHLDIPPGSLKAAQKALSSPGHFIGRQTNGFLIVDPERREAYYVYAN